MIVLYLNACPEGVRGDVTKWLMEISTGIYVGRLSLRTREALWERICKYSGSGSAVMVCSARNEQGFVYYVYNSSWQPVDFDGLTLMRRPLPVSKKTNGERAKLVDEEKNKNIAVPNLQIGRDVPRNTDGLSVTEQQAVAVQMETGQIQGTIEMSQQKMNYGQTPQKQANQTAQKGDISARTVKSTFRRNNLPLPYESWVSDTPLPKSFVVLDTETTGLDSETDHLVEIASVKVIEGKIVDEFQCLVKCEAELPQVIRDLTGLTDEDLEKGGISVSQEISYLFDFIGDAWIVGHNAAFDIRFLLKACEINGISPLHFKAMDTVSIARDVLGSSVANYRLETLTRHFGISEKQSHRALPDARLTASLYIKLNEKLDSAN